MEANTLYPKIDADGVVNKDIHLVTYQVYSLRLDNKDVWRGQYYPEDNWFIRVTGKTEQELFDKLAHDFFFGSHGRITPTTVYFEIIEIKEVRDNTTNKVLFSKEGRSIWGSGCCSDYERNPYAKKFTESSSYLETQKEYEEIKKSKKEEEEKEEKLKQEKKEQEQLQALLQKYPNQR